MFEVEAKRKTLKILKMLTVEKKNKIRELIITLKDDPLPFEKFDVAKLKGYENVYRVRIGDLRIVYEVKWDVKRVLIHFCRAEGKSLQVNIFLFPEVPPSLDQCLEHSDILGEFTRSPQVLKIP